MAVGKKTKVQLWVAKLSTIETFETSNSGSSYALMFTQSLVRYLLFKLVLTMNNCHCISYFRCSTAAVIPHSKVNNNYLWLFL